jgi:hypothetical protein
VNQLNKFDCFIITFKSLLIANILLLTACASSSDDTSDTGGTGSTVSAGVTVTAASSLTTTEAGGTVSFSVQLRSEPTANVSIPIATNDTTEGQLSISSLTFTSVNWDVAQTVTVTGQNDSDVDGNVSYSIVLSAATSGDSNYNGLNADDVSITNTDDDTLSTTPSVTFTLVDTNQSICYSSSGTNITCGTSFAGQDAEYAGNAPSYTNNGDSTITDNNTGLMWAAVTINDVPYASAATTAAASTLAGHTDWRVPTIKELYSLMDFSGATGTAGPSSSSAPNDAVPFLDTTYFDHEYATTGSRYIDSQYLTTALYVDKIFDDDDDNSDGQEGFFGVNFADGRIKGYPTGGNPGAAGWNLRLVRGTESFENNFVDNSDATITDSATSLMWMQQDSGSFSGTAGTQGDGSVDWPEALSWCEGLTHATYSDWRLPNAKEMQSIVDYSRAPDITGTPAIDPVFSTTSITDPEGDVDYPMFWTSTTHVEGDATKSVYIAFGEAQGRFNTATQATGASEPLLDVHGAGAQRSDPKITSGGTFPDYQGPQGDVRYVYNYARCVRLGL